MLFRVFLFVLAVAAKDKFENYAVEPLDGLSMSIHNQLYSYTWIRQRSTETDHRVAFENALDVTDRGMWTMILQYSEDVDYDRWIIKSTNHDDRLSCHKNAGLYALPRDVTQEEIWKLIPVKMNDGKTYYHIEVAEGDFKGYRIAMTDKEYGGCIPPPNHCQNSDADSEKCQHMNVGDGDCDDGGDCFGQLVCGTSNCADFPQQSGQNTAEKAEWDCCTNPDNKNPILSDVWRFTDVFSSEGAFSQIYKITNRGACTIDLEIRELFGYSKSYETSISNTLSMGWSLKESASAEIAGSGFSEEMTASLNEELTNAVDEAMQANYEIEFTTKFTIEPHKCMVLKQFKVRSEEEITVAGQPTGVTFYSKEFDWGYCEASGDLGKDDDTSNCPGHAIDISLSGGISNSGGYGGLDVEGANGISTSSTMAFTREAQAQEPLSASRVVLGGLAAFGLGVSLYGAAMHYMKQGAGHAYSEC